ncbi:MAG: PQQ-binding-like beta-propeller repeat protein [Actinomycetota bacterium]|nr:PQQ-binding-like beta-propeller repeat protein [Actinomycetota bacterium]
MVAADLRTSDVLWRVEGFETGSELGAQLSATENAVLVSSGGGQTWVLDPADGKQRWDLTSSHLGEWVLHQQALVQRSSDSGQVDAYDLTTGRRLWSIAPAGNQVDKILGTRVHGQELLDDGYTDNHLVVVRRSGQVQVRDIVSGDVLRTMTPVSPPSDGNTLVAYEGKLYDGGPGCCDTEPYRVVVTDLGTGASKKVFTGKLEHTVGSMTVCGAGRVCLVDQESDTVSWVRTIDATSGQVIWSVPGPVGGSSLVANGTEMLVGGGDDGGTKLIDGNGREVFRTPAGVVEWLDGGRLLMLPRATGGAVMTVNTVYGTVNQLGTLAATAGPCAHTPDRLVCPTSTDVRIYQLRE